KTREESLPDARCITRRFQMSRPRTARLGKLGWLLLGLLGVATGCSSSANSPLGFQPPQHRLSDSANALRSSPSEPPPRPRDLPNPPLPAFLVEPGDSLLVQPVNLDSPIRLPSDQPVLIDGTVDLGKYGRPVVAGKTVPMIEAEIQALVAS